MTPKNAPGNQEEFEALMRELDEHLREDGVPIPYRELRLLQDLAQHLGEGFSLSLPKREPETFEGVDLMIRASRWVKDRYGKRLAWDPRPARVVVLIRRDPWELWLPRFYGSHRLTADPEAPSDAMDQGRADRDAPMPTFNVLEAVTDLTPSLRKDLSEEECGDILRLFRTTLENLTVLESGAKRHQLLRRALSDLETTTNLILGPSPGYGQAKWAALQHAEKALKSFITAAGESPPHTHDLMRLADQAFRLGCSRVPARSLGLVQCRASVRYGEPSVSLVEAVEAQHAALDIAAHVVADFVLYSF